MHEPLGRHLMPGAPRRHGGIAVTFLPSVIIARVL
jgi:hypothetical protein